MNGSDRRLDDSRVWVAQALFPESQAPVQLHGQPDQRSQLRIDPIAVGRSHPGPSSVQPSPKASREGVTPTTEQSSTRRDSSPSTAVSASSGTGTRTPPTRQASLASGSDFTSRNGGSTGQYGPIGVGRPLDSDLGSPRRRAKSAQVAEPADWHAIATNGQPTKGRSASLANPHPLPENAQTRRPIPQHLASSSSPPPPPPVPGHNGSRAIPTPRFMAHSNGMSQSTSVASTLSAATSNSSTHPRGPPGPHPTPHPGSGAYFNNATDPDGVAALVQQLYARLDDQGVYGDGWDEGKERSRDGIILRLDPERDLPPPSPKPHSHQVAIPNDPDLVAKADQVLRRVDR